MWRALVHPEHAGRVFSQLAVLVGRPPRIPAIVLAVPSPQEELAARMPVAIGPRPGVMAVLRDLRVGIIERDRPGRRSPLDGGRPDPDLSAD